MAAVAHKAASCTAAPGNVGRQLAASPLPPAAGRLVVSSVLVGPAACPARPAALPAHRRHLGATTADSSSTSTTSSSAGQYTTSEAESRSAGTASTSASTSTSTSTSTTIGGVVVHERFWSWRYGSRVRFLQAGTRGPPILLLHGFGVGAYHYERNIPALAQHARVWSIDFLGQGERGPGPGGLLGVRGGRGLRRSQGLGCPRTTWLLA